MLDDGIDHDCNDDHIVILNAIIIYYYHCLSSRHYFACWLVPEARISLALKENQAIAEHLAFILRIRLRCSAITLLQQ